MVNALIEADRKSRYGPYCYKMKYENHEHKIYSFGEHKDGCRILDNVKYKDINTICDHLNMLSKQRNNIRSGIKILGRILE